MDVDSSEEYSKIIEIFADDLSDVPSEDEDVDALDDESNSESSKSDSDIPKKKLNNGLDDFSNLFHYEIKQEKLEDWEITIPISEPISITTATNIIFGNDLFDIFCQQLSIYNDQASEKHKKGKSLKWSSVTPTEMRKFLSLILLMGFTRKDNWREYWSTDPLLIIPIFPETMSRNRFEQIWTFWHFNDNDKIDESSSRFFKIQLVFEYFINKFKTAYKPKQQLLLDESIIPWKERPKFQFSSLAKIAKYGLLVRTVCENHTGYIYNMEISISGEKEKLNETALSMVDPNCQNVSIANTYLKHEKRRECRIKRANRSFLLSVNKAQYNSHIKGIILADKYLSYCLLKKSVKWTKKIVLFLIHCGLFNSFRIFQTQNPQTKIKYKQFLLAVARDWMSYREIEDPLSGSFSPPNVCTKRAPRKDHPQRLSGNYITQHIPIQIPSLGKKKSPTRACRVCITHGKRSETRYICKFCAVPLHIRECFTKYHSLEKY